MRSKRKLTSRTTVLDSKCLKSKAPPILHSTFPRRSALPTIPSYSQSHPLATYEFVRTATSMTDTGVKFTQSSTGEIIEIATDWKKGYELLLDSEDDSVVNYHHTGFIGKGYSKCAIYVSHTGIHSFSLLPWHSSRAASMAASMAITQIIGTGNPPGVVENLMREEYRLLCFGDWVKRAFDRYAKENGVYSLPRE